MAFFKNIIADARGEAPDGNFAFMKDATGDVSKDVGGWRYADFGLSGNDDQRVESFNGSLMKKAPIDAEANERGLYKPVDDKNLKPLETILDADQNGVPQYGIRADELDFCMENDLTPQKSHSEDDSVDNKNSMSNLENQNQCNSLTGGKNMPVNRESHDEADNKNSMSNLENLLMALNLPSQNAVNDDAFEKTGIAESNYLNTTERSGYTPLTGNNPDIAAVKRLNAIEHSAPQPALQIFDESGKKNSLTEQQFSKSVSEPVEIRNEINGRHDAHHQSNAARINERMTSKLRNDSNGEIKKNPLKVQIGQVDVVVQLEERADNFTNQKMSRVDKSVSKARRYLRGV